MSPRAKSKKPAKCEKLGPLLPKPPKPKPATQWPLHGKPCKFCQSPKTRNTNGLVWCESCGEAYVQTKGCGKEDLAPEK